MDKVLVVDRDIKFLKNLTMDFSRIQLFEITTANDFETALCILEKENISVLVTEFDESSDQGLELLAHIAGKWIHMPCIVLSNNTKPWFYKPREQKENLYYIEKPVTAASLSSAIIVALSLRDEGVSSAGFSLTSFLPLVEMVKKTCCLWVTSRKNGKGFLYFHKGRLVDAKYKLMSPMKAVAEMLTWKGIEYSFSDFPGGGPKNSMNLDVMELVGAAWKKSPAADVSENKTANIRKSKEKKSEFELYSDLQNYFESFLPFLQAVKGYRAVGIIDSDLNIVSGPDLRQALRLKDSSPSDSSIVDAPSLLKTMRKISGCNMIAIHTTDYIVQVLCCGRRHSAPLYIVGITKTDGNWIFIKREMEKINSFLMER